MSRPTTVPPAMLIIPPTALATVIITATARDYETKFIRERRLFETQNYTEILESIIILVLLRILAVLR